jgi:phage-related protein
MGSSRRDLLRCPQRVQDLCGFALSLAQRGEKHADAKPFKGFGDAGILEIAVQVRGESYRAVYTVRYAEAIYVLHVFHKKSRRGIATPRDELNLVRSRLKQVQQLHFAHREQP